MNSKNENGFITELLTIGIIIMLIVLGIFLIYISNMEKYLEQDTNITYAEEYKNPEESILDENIIENSNFNSTVEQNTVSTSYNLNEILQSYTTNYNNQNNNTVIPTNNYDDDYNRYYYNQLNDYAKAIYDVIYNNKENLKSGVYSMAIPDYVSNILYEENGKQLLTTSFQDAIDALKTDNPDLFYISFNKILLITETTTRGNSVTYRLNLENNEGDTYLLPSFSNSENVVNAINQLENKKREILNNAIGSDYDKIKYIHNWLVDNIEYDDTISRENTHNIYGALIENKVVCDGYARAFKYLLDELGIPCVIAQGTATNSEGISESHAWNYVRIYGKWYAIDVTWDDPIVEGWSIFHSDTKYTYFLKGSSTIYQDHTENGRISENGKQFSYPKLSYDDYE